MSQTSEVDYLRAREAQECEAAAQAEKGPIRDLHFKRAEEFAERWKLLIQDKLKHPASSL